MDPTWTRISSGIQLSQQGETEQARSQLSGIWTELTEDQALYRLVTAHFLADLQADLDDELRWDQRALDAFPAVSAEDFATVGMAGTERGMLPSLHLNLGDAWYRKGDRDKAREHLDLGLAAVDALGDDGYGTMIRQGFDRLAERLAA